MQKSLPKKFRTFLTITTALLLSNAAFAADATAPTTTISLSPANPNGKNNWYVAPVAVTLTATDLESGVASINYRVDASPWQTINYSNSLNLAPNPSFEDIDNANTPPTQDWNATIQDANTTYLRDTSNYAPNYGTSSIEITTTGTGWHGINNLNSFASAAPLSNMSASAWIKTSNVAGSAFFKVYIVSQDNLGTRTYTYLAQSNSVTSTSDWTKLTADFVVNDPNAVGVYLDIGLTETGTIWADAVSIAATNTAATTEFTVGNNGIHSIEYYAADNANNTETHACPNTNCKTVKIDQDPPGSWHDAGAVRGQGSDHELYIYTNVADGVSGMSNLSNKYVYHVDSQTGFGRFQNLLFCNTPWQENTWVDLASQPFADGTQDVQLKTQKTDLCNSDWKICKTVRFYAEDMAGNNNTKDFCLNGPWIQVTGGGIVKSNGGIDMVAEPPEENTDGLVEVGNNLFSFFSTSTDWAITNAPESKVYNYDKWLGQVKPAPTTITGLSTTTGVYKINSSFELKNSTIPNSYKSANFTQVIFINGDLKISNNISVAGGSAALFIVKGKVEIAKAVDTVAIAIFADGDLYSAYNIAEGQTASTINFDGIFTANKFWLQRTLQGTNNSKYPSESFVFEPKYSQKIGTYLGTNSVKWISSN